MRNLHRLVKSNFTSFAYFLFKNKPLSFFYPLVSRMVLPTFTRTYVNLFSFIILSSVSRNSQAIRYSVQYSVKHMSDSVGLPATNWRKLTLDIWLFRTSKCILCIIYLDRSCAVDFTNNGCLYLFMASAKRGVRESVCVRERSSTGSSRRWNNGIRASIRENLLNTISRAFGGRYLLILPVRPRIRFDPDTIRTSWEKLDVV